MMRTESSMFDMTESHQVIDLIGTTISKLDLRFHKATQGLSGTANSVKQDYFKRLYFILVGLMVSPWRFL